VSHPSIYRYHDCLNALAPRVRGFTDSRAYRQETGRRPAEDPHR
jgi:hypothetical protein